MSAPGTACAECLRRSWLLGELGPVLDRLTGDRSRLLDTLALDRAQLLAALGGRRRGELQARMDALAEHELGPPAPFAAVCRHAPGCPAAMLDPAAPTMLFHDGSRGLVEELLAGPVVALVAATRTSDYGAEVARALARGLSVAGVTVAAAARGAVPDAVHRGAAEVGCASIAAAAGGLGTATTAHRQPPGTGRKRRACTVSELPCASAGRRWGAVAAERVLVGLCAVLVVVECSDAPAELASAELARAGGRVVAAVPGRVTSPLSAGPHALLRDGARLARSTGDVLELLDRPAAPGSWTPGGPAAGLEPRLRGVLERVAGGCETAEELCHGAPDPTSVLLALSELELLGVLLRGEGGRYLPSAAPPA
ncbi:MAG TPA: DNA-processing protein DprA [Solirubrobacteraceae bacterium]